MKLFKQQFTLFASLMLAIGLAGCSKDDNNLVTPEPPTPSETTTVPLTQFEVILGNQFTSGTTNNRSTTTRVEMGAFNNPKTQFSAQDVFTFNYTNVLQSAQEAYAYTSDGRTWTIHERKDANSPVKTVQLNSKSPILTASYLPENATGADKDGIVVSGTGNAMTVGCFDALRATAEITVSNNKATAKVPFKHVNHLLNFYVTGTINEDLIEYLELNVTYTDASGKQLNAVLATSSRSSYADINGAAHTVIQAIVPRGATVTGIKAIKLGNSEINATGPINISCPGGKSHLITLSVNDTSMSAQVGSLIDDWAFGGELNPDGSPVGDIFIGTEDQLRGFANAVNINPSEPAAKIDGVLAYTAHVVQTANITLSNIEWRPIGGKLYKSGTDADGDNFDVTYFAGTYNGNGHTISGIKVTTSSADGSNSAAIYGGFFGRVQSPAEGYTILTNIKLTNVDIQLSSNVYHSYAGALAGQAYADKGTNPIVISQCSVQGSTISVSNTDGIVTVGGLVGETGRTHITGSNSDISVTANASRSSYAGGIVGSALSSSIASSYAKKDVTAKSTSENTYAGGVIGSLTEYGEYSYVLACSSDGNVTSTGNNTNGNNSNAGGVVGANSGNIAGCYAKGNITATGSNSKAGAIVGDGSSDINLCYGAGTVGQGTSNLKAREYSIVYNTAPSTGNILSIVSGKALKDADADNEELGSATVGGILTTFTITEGGKTKQEVKFRLWALSDDDVWTTASPASSIYPLPVSSYKGQ